MELLPHFPLHLNSMALFGLTLLLGLIGGELAKRARFLPIITGYIAIGFLMGPGGFNIANPSILATARIFVDIACCLILFKLGRHLDFRWINRDRGLLPTAIAESGLTFLLIFIIINQFVGLSRLQSSLAATIAMATSPAVVMMIANDLSSEGPVTRRTLILTSINNFFALIIFTLLLAFSHPQQTSVSVNLIHGAYQIIGSILLGIIMYAFATGIAFLVGKNKENQFVLFVGLIMLTISLAHILNLSAMLALFILGVSTRNFNIRQTFIEVNFGWLAKVSFILLFVVTGINLQLSSLWKLPGLICLLILARGLAKTAGIALFSKSSHLTSKQVIAISLALSPMAGVAIGMTNILVNFNPSLGNDLLVIITGIVAILNLVGPIATQFAFIKTGETLSERTLTKEVQYGNAINI